jgi:uncharacterized repeat protein (TIGR04076 family)
MFKVKITLVDFLGDEEKYPCHFQHKIGDEIIFDGEKYIGKLCPAVWTLVVPKVDELWSAGPRHVPPPYYFPFWYAPVSVKDPSRKDLDGLGFKNVFKTHVEPRRHIAALHPKGAYEWPPTTGRTVGRKVMATCQDMRTAAVFSIEAFDLADVGLAIPYYRRQMNILERIAAKPGIAVNKILNEFTKKEIEEIYPALNQEIMIPLLEELECLGYVKIAKATATVTKKGEAKLKKYLASLTEKEKKAYKKLK